MFQITNCNQFKRSKRWRLEVLETVNFPFGRATGQERFQPDTGRIEQYASTSSDETLSKIGQSV